MCLFAQVIEVEEETVDAVGSGASLGALRQNRHVPRHRLEQVGVRQLRSEDEHRGLRLSRHLGQVGDLDDVRSVAQGVESFRDLVPWREYDERTHST